MGKWLEYLKREEEKKGVRTFDLLSPPSEMEALMKGVAWADISKFLSNRLIQIRDTLETLGSEEGFTPAEVSSSLAFLQGQSHQLRLLQDLPEMLLEDLRNREQQKEEEKEDGD